MVNSFLLIHPIFVLLVNFMILLSAPIMEIYLDVRTMRKDKVVLWGGIGEKNSNNGTQFYIQNRIYDSDYLCPALNSYAVYWIIIKE